MKSFYAFQRACSGKICRCRVVGRLSWLRDLTASMTEAMKKWKNLSAEETHMTKATKMGWARAKHRTSAMSVAAKNKTKDCNDPA